MGDRDREPEQLVFREGELVQQTSTTGRSTDDLDEIRIEPGDESGYAVEVKSGALETNSALTAVVEEHGRVLEFGSRDLTEAYAAHLSAGDGPLRVQDAPANEPADVDGYLLADHDPSIEEPAEIDGDTWTFDVGANLYGTLGESILLESPKPHALYYFVRQDLALDDEPLDDGLHLDVQSATPISIDDADQDRMTWVPDCEIVAKDGWSGRVLERYYCEIKTGNASFERSQIDVMESVATEARVLKIRIVIDDLPDQYALRIHEVEPPTDRSSPT